MLLPNPLEVRQVRCPSFQYMELEAPTARKGNWALSAGVSSGAGHVTMIQKVKLVFLEEVQILLDL